MTRKHNRRRREISHPATRLAAHQPAANSRTNSPDLGIVRDPLLVLANQRLNAISIILPGIGALGALLSLNWQTPNTHTIIVFSIAFIAQVLGIGMGLHRYFSHHAFRCGRCLHLLLGVLGTCALQGPIVRWVADHRVLCLRRDLGVARRGHRCVRRLAG